MKVIINPMSKEHIRLQLEMAASGCISGTLDQWPHLQVAFQQLGYNISKNTLSSDLRTICRNILSSGNI